MLALASKAGGTSVPPNAIDPVLTPAPERASRLSDATRLGPVHLVVTDLDRAVGWYADALGLRLHRREDPVAALGAGEDDVVVLHEEPGARRAGRHAGLFHAALLYPSRLELARVAVRLAESRARVDGASDHGTHEAIYLSDPDGNGLELAADRPREAWPDLAFLGGPAPLDLDGLLALTAGEEPIRYAAPGLRVGHVHLHVGDLEAAARFYRDGLGMDEVTRMPTAVFLSAGGYHHHVAVNVWRGRGVPPAPPGVVGLRHWTLEVAGADELERVRELLAALGAPAERVGDGVLVRDPSGNAVLVVEARAGS
jgi:catechol 2,3-dioxygenase